MVIVLAVLAVAVCLAVVLGIRYWPFEQKAVIEDLEESSDSQRAALDRLDDIGRLVAAAADPEGERLDVARHPAVLLALLSTMLWAAGAYVTGNDPNDSYIKDSTTLEVSEKLSSGKVILRRTA